jgi:hypothetical protein
MRNLLLYCLIALLPGIASAQSSYIKHFYNKYKSEAEVTNINMGSFLIRMVGTFSDDEDAKKILKKVSHLRMLMMEDDNLVSPEAYTSLIRGIRSDDFEELIQIRDKGQRIDFFLREDEEDTITDILMILRGDDEFLLLSLEGALQFSDLNNISIDIEGGNYFSRLPDRKPKA